MQAAILGEYEKVLEANDALDYSDFVSRALWLLKEKKEGTQGQGTQETRHCGWGC